MQEYGKYSETAEVLVNYDGLANPSWLKVQSGPFGDIRGIPGDQLVHNIQVLGKM